MTMQKTLGIYWKKKKQKKTIELRHDSIKFSEYRITYTNLLHFHIIAVNIWTMKVRIQFHFQFQNNELCRCK